MSMRSTSVFCCFRVGNEHEEHLSFVTLGFGKSMRGTSVLCCFRVGNEHEKHFIFVSLGM